MSDSWVRLCLLGNDVLKLSVCMIPTVQQMQDEIDASTTDDGRRFVDASKLGDMVMQKIW